MNIEYIQWDSDFFNKKIGRILCPINPPFDEFNLLLDQAKTEGYDLIYCFGGEDLFIDELSLNQYNGALVDRKVIYGGRVSEEMYDKGVIKEYTGQVANQTILDLAYLSGEYSRFKQDANFGESSYERLYKIWIDRSISKEIAEVVLTAELEGRIVGLLTLRTKEDVGEIGLLAVGEVAQGEGIGRQLVDAAKNYLYKKQIPNITVATQFKNEQACSFYEKNELRKKTITNVYHFWL